MRSLADSFKSILLLFLLASMPTFAQQGTVLPLDQSLDFEHLTVRDGLSHNQTFNVLQDRQGFIWIATRFGLNKYDGNKFTVYTHDSSNSTGLNVNHVWHLYEDLDGKLWASTWGGGVNRFDPLTETFTHFRYDENVADSLSSDLVWSVYQDSRGTIWVATDDGFNKFDPETNRFKRYQHDLNNPESLSHNSVTFIQEDETGVLWLSTYGGGLNRFDPISEKFTHYHHVASNPNSLSNDLAWTVYIDSIGLIWVGTEGGLNRFDPATESFTHYQHRETSLTSLSHNTVSTIYQDSRGILWVGTLGGGLNRLNPEDSSFIHYSYQDNNSTSLASNTVWDISEDNTGTLWIATQSGLDKVDPLAVRFLLFQHNPQDSSSLSNNRVTALYHADDGNLWIGTNGGGLNQFNRDQNLFTPYQMNPNDPNSLSNNHVTTIQPGNDSTLWIGTRTGLNRFDPTTGRFTRYVYDSENPNSLPNDDINALATDKNGMLWIASFGGGLFLFDPVEQVFRRFRQNENLPTSWLTAVVITYDGLIWIGGAGGLSQFDPRSQSLINYSVEDNRLSNENVTTIYQDSQGTIWVGTEDGLNKYNAVTDTFVTYHTKDGLAGNLVAAILEEDNQGYLWISTNNGLSRFDPQAETFRNYDTEDGLQSNQFWVRAAAKSIDDELFFGGFHGFNAFFPNDLTYNPFIPPVVLTDFQLFNQPVVIGGESPLQKHINFADEIVLTHDQSVFTLEFAALNYRSSNKNQYAYIMEGFDKDWTFVGSTRRIATYTNLNPGSYTFRVKASNNDGVWNETGTAIKLTIIPAWWQTWWFYTLLVGLAFSIFGLIYQTKARQLHTERIMTEKLRKSEERFSKAFRSSPIPMVMAYAQTTEIIEVNDAWSQLVGYSPEEAVGHTAVELGITDQKIHQKLLDELSIKGTIHNFESTIKTRTNQQRYVLVSRESFEVSGELGILATIIDITEHKQANEMVRRERDFSEAIIDSLPGVFYLFDEANRFLRWNKNFTQVTGYTNTEMAERHPLDFFDGTDKELLAERIREVFTQGVSSVEADFVAKDGTRTPYYFTGIRVSLDNKVCLLGVGIDISERKQTEAALQASQTQLRLAIEAANVGLWDWDLKANTVYYSPEWKRQIGYAEDEITNDFNEWQSRIHPDDIEHILNTVNAYIQDPWPNYETEFRLRHKDGSYRWILARGSLFLDDKAQPYRMLGSHLDITERKQLQEKNKQLADQFYQAQKMESIGRLAGGIAHDFNNILVPIIGYTELGMRIVPSDDKLHNYLNGTHEAAKQAAVLTQQILAFSRRQVLAMQVVDLNTIVADFEKMIKRLIEENIELQTSLEPALYQVKVDKSQIEQALMNLVVNARDAMPTGGKLTIETANVYLDEAYTKKHTGAQPPGYYAMLAVSDTGHGMNTEIQRRIFEPFFTTKEQGKGTGLGLATVFGIVQQHQGNIWVYSEPGKGTTFKIYLPQTEETTIPASMETSPPRSLHGKETILLVEDQDMVRKLVSEALEAYGYNVIEASTPTNGLQRADEIEGSIHLLLTDVIMPEMNGREFYQRVSPLHPDMKVLYMSGYTDNVIVHHGVLDEGIDFLEKPFTVQNLILKVRQILG